MEAKHGLTVHGRYLIHAWTVIRVSLSSLYTYTCVCVGVWLCVYIHVHTYTHPFINIHTCVCSTYTHEHTYTHPFIYIHTCVCTHTNTHTHTSIYMCTCMRVCECACVLHGSSWSSCSKIHNIQNSSESRAFYSWIRLLKIKQFHGTKAFSSRKSIKKA